MAHIVIIGNGIASLTAALQLKKLVSEQDWITVVSKERYGTIKSALPYVSMGLRSLKDVRVDLGKLFDKFDIKYLFSSVTELHPERQVIILENGQRLPFDNLIIADGMEPAWDHIPGLNRSHNMIHSLMTADETMRAELAFKDFLHSPGPMTIACAPGSTDYQSAYQYVLNVDHVLRRYRIRDKVPIRFITPEPFLGHLGIGGVGHSNALFENEFRSRQIEYYCNAAIDSVDKTSFNIVYFDADGLERGQKDLTTKFGLIWPAMRAENYIINVNGLTDKTGLIQTNKFLQSSLYRNIFAIGEIVTQSSLRQAALEPTPMETGQPCSDFLKESMTSTVAGNLAEILSHRYPCYEPTGNGFFMINFGEKGAAFLAVPQNPPRNIDRIIEGRFVHIAQKGMERYHLSRLRAGVTEPIFERLIFRLMKMPRIKQKAA